MKVLARIISAVAFSSIMLLGLAVSPASAAAPPQVTTNEAAGKSHVVVDGTKSDANLQTPTVNSKIIIEASGVGWAWTDEYTYYPQKVNVYEVPSVVGDMKWHILDTRDPDVYIVSGNIDTRFPQERVIDVYGADGYYEVNGRQWMTECEPYSQTERCRTDIWATQSSLQGGKVVTETGWVFNNLTYQPSDRSLWANNPLGNSGEWTAADGRHWRTECDTAKTGRNGCRSYIYLLVADADGNVSMKWVFNNIVRFS